jgi:hypothetical protein
LQCWLSSDLSRPITYTHILVKDFF